MSAFEIQRDVTDSTVVLKLGGLMDYSTIEGFEPDLPPQTKRVTVDFSKLDFIDSTGIGAVLAILHESSELAATVEFTGLNEEVSQLFDVVGVFKIMEVLRGEGPR